MGTWDSSRAPEKIETTGVEFTCMSPSARSHGYHQNQLKSGDSTVPVIIRLVIVAQTV